MRSSWPKVALLALASGATPLWADDFDWSNPWGAVTIVEQGPAASYLDAWAKGGTTDEESFLFYNDALSLPAQVEAASSSGNSSVAAAASMSVEESQVDGLYISGSLSATPVSGSLSSGATVDLFLLLQPAPNAGLEISNLTNLASRFDAQANFFSLQLFPGDLAGEQTGPALLVLQGNLPQQQNAFFASNAASYILELKANVGTGIADAEQFSFNFDFVASDVPEASTAALCGVGVIFIGTARRRGRCSLGCVLSTGY